MVCLCNVSQKESFPYISIISSISASQIPVQVCSKNIGVNSYLVKWKATLSTRPPFRSLTTVYSML